MSDQNLTLHISSLQSFLYHLQRLNLVMERRSQSMAQKTLAHLSGYSLSTIYLWERGQRIPNARQLHDWRATLFSSNACDTMPSQLIGASDGRSSIRSAAE